MKLVCIDGHWLNPDHIVRITAGTTKHAKAWMHFMDGDSIGFERDAASIAGSINHQSSEEQGP